MLTLRFGTDTLKLSLLKLQEQTLGGKKRPSVVNPLGMLYTVLGTIKIKNKKNRLGNIAFVA